MQPSVQFQTPKIDWEQLDYIQQEDFNRIEGNILYLYESWDEFINQYGQLLQDFLGYSPSDFQPQIHTHSVNDLTGVLPISKGGTGSTSFSQNKLIKFDGSQLVSTNIDENEVVKTLFNFEIKRIQTGLDLAKSSLNVEQGSIYVQSDTKKIYQFTGSTWQMVGSGQENQETNRLQKFLDNLGTLGNQNIWDFNNRIGIGIQTPSYDLHVIGYVKQDGFIIDPNEAYIYLTEFKLPGGVINGDLQIVGNLITTGDIQYIQSEELLIQDPLIIIGGINEPTMDDMLDRGVAFRWHDGTSPKIGFFGFKRSTQKFMYIPNQSIQGNVVTGQKGEIDSLVSWTNIINKPTISLQGEVTGSQQMTDLGQTIITSVTGQSSTNQPNTVVRRDQNGNFQQGIITASLNGNQTTQTRLQTQRTITLSGQVTGSQSFDGSQNITINTSVNHNHGAGIQNYVVKFADGQGNLTNSNIADSGTLVTVSSPLKVNYSTLVQGQLTSSSQIPTSEQDWLTFNGQFRQTKVWGAVYNDYQEFRPQIKTIEQGYAQILDQKSGKLKQCDVDQQQNQFVVSDTYGMVVGNDREEFQTPVQIQGRVLQYVENKEKLKVGDLLVTTKRGTLRKMKWWEKLFIGKYINRIVGVVDEIPDYEIWNNVKVNGRVWIRVK